MAHPGEVARSAAARGSGSSSNEQGGAPCHSSRSRSSKGCSTTTSSARSSRASPRRWSPSRARACAASRGCRRGGPQRRLGHRRSADHHRGRPGAGRGGVMRRLVVRVAVRRNGAGGVAAAAASKAARGPSPGPRASTSLRCPKGTIGASVHATGAGRVRHPGPQGHADHGDHRRSRRHVRLAQPPGPGARGREQGHADALPRRPHRCRRMPSLPARASSRPAASCTSPATRATVAVELNATFLARPGTKNFLVPQAQPAACPGVR